MQHQREIQQLPMLKDHRVFFNKGTENEWWEKVDCNQVKKQFSSPSQ